MGLKENKPGLDAGLFAEAAVFFDQLHQFLLVGIGPLWSGKRFVVAVHDENHIGRNMLQILFVVRETLVAGPLIGHVA